MKKSAWFFFFLLLTLSCLDEPDCYQLNANVIGVRFRVIGSELFDTLALNTIQVASLNIAAATRTTQVALPLDFTSPESDIIFNLGDNSTRTLKLGYAAQVQYVSEECGVRYILSGLKNIESGLTTDFDSVRIVNGTPGKSASNNIEVFRCPQTNLLTVSFRDLYLNTDGVEAQRAGSARVESITSDYEAVPQFEDTSRINYKLRVNLESNETEFTFRLAGANANEVDIKKLKVSYKKRNVVFPGCGTEPKRVVDSLVVETSDTPFTRAALVEGTDGVVRRRLTDPSQPNIYLYRCPQTNLVKIDFKARTSPTSNTFRAQAVALESVTANADYTDRIFYANDSISSITVPVNPVAGTTEFYIKYKATPAKTDTLKLSYVTSDQTPIEGCPVKIYSNLQLEGDAENTSINVLTTGTTLRFPPVSNIEIITQ